MFALDSQIPSFYLLVRPSIQWLPVLFRTLSLIVVAPVIFFAMLDVVAYLIGRTLGARHTVVRVASTKSDIVVSITEPQLVEPDSLTSALSNLASKIPLTNDISAPPILQVNPLELNSTASTTPDDLLSPTSHLKFPHHFTTPSEGNFALSGEGVFSPPESRSGSPPLERKRYRRSRAASVGVDALGAITGSSSDEETESTSLDSVDGGNAAVGLNAKDSGSIMPVDPNAALRKRKPNLQSTSVKS